MRNIRSLGSVWNSLRPTSRVRRTPLQRPALVEAFETRVLPSVISITASVDGYARDANRNGVFTVLDDSSENLLTRASTQSTIGIERAMFEFDLTATSKALNVNSVTFVVNISQFTRSGTTLPRINLYGYTGDGVIALEDATAAGPLVANTTITATGELRLQLDLDYVRSQFGNFLGLRIENAVLNGPFAVFNALESTFPEPRLELDIRDTTFNIDERRPRGTIVGSIGIGTNATYVVTGGDPGNAFTLNPTTGVITVRDPAQLDFSTNPQYVLNVEVTLSDGTVGTLNVTINVKNVFGPNTPPVITASQFEVEEFSPANTVVGRVEGFDPDSADPLTYSITGGNLGNAFRIDPRTGIISVNDQYALVFAQNPSFVLDITARDTRIPQSTVTQKIQIFITPRVHGGVNPNFVRLLPATDVEARDINSDGIFESVNPLAERLYVRPAEPGFIARRPIMEFDLSSISRNQVVKSATLTVYVNSHAGNTIPINVYGYSGDGVITASDALLGTLIGSKTFTINGVGDLRAYSIELNPALVQQLLGTSTFLGITLRNDVNQNVLGIDSTKGPVNLGQPLSRQPALNLVLEEAADDVVFRSGANNALTVARSNGTTFDLQSAAVLRPGVTFSELVTGDFNGDGRIDIAGRNSANGQVLVALASGNQFVTSSAAWTTLPFASTMRDLYVGDFNGDGRDDIVGRNAQGQLVVAVSAGNKFNNAVFETLPVAFRSLTNVQVGDFNGDGLDDLMGISTSGQVVVSLSTGNSFVTSVWATLPAGAAVSEVNVGDFNGDGRDDVFFKQGAASLVVLRSTGTAFTNTLFGTLPAGVPYIGFRKGDFNGDGRTDIVGFTGTGAMTIFRSTGTSFTMVGGGSLAVPANGINPSDIVVGDFNRDGKSDILLRQTVTTTINKVTTTSQRLFVAAGTTQGFFSNSLFGTIHDAGPFTLLGVGNF